MVMALGGIVMTKFAVDLGVPHAAGRAVRHRRDRAVRPDQRPARHAHQAAAVHRHARHVQHRLRDHAALLGRADHHRPAAADDCAGQHLRARRHRRRLRHGADARCCTSGVWFCAARNRCRAPCLRGRQQPRGDAPGRHPDRARAARRVRAGRRVLRHRLAAGGGAHRCRRPQRRADREPRRHHRGGARRHQPVRRARRHPRHAGRRA